MKSIIASVLTIVYAVFITGSVWTAQDTGDFIFAETGEVYTLNTASHEPVKISLNKNFNVVHFGKVIKHLAVGGKTKVPRSGYTPAVFTNFVSNLCPFHSSLAIATEQPDIYPHPIFLKNGVLRI
jgi:hypothetical protein